MRIGILGSGAVAKSLGAGFARQGNEVMFGTRNTEANRPSLEAAVPGAQVGTFEQAARHGEVLVVCVHGTACIAVVQAAGPENLAGKLVLDTTNPIEFSARGVEWSSAIANSCLETMQAAAPDAHFVKAWNCVPGVSMANPQFAGGPGTQFICGGNENAKVEAIRILKRFGWNAHDVGGAYMARFVEGMALTVIGYGARHDDWGWGLKLLDAKH